MEKELERVGRELQEVKRRGTEGGAVGAVPAEESERKDDIDTSLGSRAAGPVMQRQPLTLTVTKPALRERKEKGAEGFGGEDCQKDREDVVAALLGRG